MSDEDQLKDSGSVTNAYRVKSPGDGVYQVRLVGEDAANTANLSFTSSSNVRTVNLKPGPYTAWIEPLGGGAIQQEVMLDAAGTVQLRDEVSWGLTSPTWVGPARPSWTGTAEAKSTAREAVESTRSFAVAISVDDRPGEIGGWRGASPQMVQNYADGNKLLFQLKRPTDWRNRHRWRMTIAIAERGPWRVPLPLFRGGLQVALAPSVTPTGSDIALNLAPIDPAKAALVASLHQMFGGSASDVVRAAASSGISGTASLSNAIDLLSDRLDDPWAAAAAALLMARSGEIDKVEAGARRLQERFQWLPDAAVAVAWADAGAKRPQHEAEARCLKGIKTARLAGATYFIAADALAVDMLTALSLSGADAAMKTAARKELAVWTRRSRRRMPSGPFLSWEDPPIGKGNLLLSGKDYHIVARGHLTGDKVVVERKISPPSKGKRQTAPALSRSVITPEDHNKGRFGGKSRVNGYTLGATFGRGASDWVRINLVVRAPEKSDAKEVELFLHDTFHPDHLMVPFKQGVASFTTWAYGGFTVGAWVAQAKVELELDLTCVKGAPRTILEN